MKHLASLNHFFFKYRFRFLLGIVFIVLTNYFRILAPQLTGYVVNAVVNTIEAGKTTNVAAIKEKQHDLIVQKIIVQIDTLPLSKKILWCGIILLVLAIISGFFMFLMRQTIIVMSRLIEYDQKNQVFAHYQQLDTNFYKTHSTGDLMNRISEDISRDRKSTRLNSSHRH